MIFGNIETEAKCQTYDRVRINCIKSFITPDEAAITKVEIKPSAADAFITVAELTTATDMDKYYLDWIYTTAGTKTITLQITTSAAPVTFTASIVVLDKNTEVLFSSDNDLYNIENDILKFVPAGKNSFVFVHRQVKEDLLEEIYRNKILNTTGQRLVEADVIDSTELKYWAKYRALRIIFEGLSNAVDDIFDKKASKYGSQENEWRNQTFNILVLDYNSDGIINDADRNPGLSDQRSTGLLYR